jgi:hypothetical protein
MDPLKLSGLVEIARRRREGPRGRFHIINYISQKPQFDRSMKQDNGKSSVAVLLAHFQHKCSV